MVQSVYSRISKVWKKPRSGPLADLHHERLIQWRRGASFTRIEKPTRLDRARALGYKAKQGYVLVRAKVRRSNFRKRHPVRGRKPTGVGISKLTVYKNLRWIAEERVGKRHQNLEVLNSYWVGEDGKYKFFEIILVDPDHPCIKSDPKINWICEPQHHGRPYRGKTGAGHKGRGLRWKGKGAERLRPSRRKLVRGRRKLDRKRQASRNRRMYA
jgi:large subunit ribosomal protein L15e